MGPIQSRPLKVQRDTEVWSGDALKTTAEQSAGRPRRWNPNENQPHFVMFERQDFLPPLPPPFLPCLRFLAFHLTPGLGPGGGGEMLAGGGGG